MKLPPLHTVDNIYDPTGRYEYVHIKDGFAWVSDKLVFVKYKLPDELAGVSARIHFDQWKVIAKQNILSFTPEGDKLHVILNYENCMSATLDLLPLDEMIVKMQSLYDATIKEQRMPHCVVSAELLNAAVKFIGDDAITISATEKTVIVSHAYYTMLIAQIQQEPYAAL